MADPLTSLKQRSKANWLVGHDSQEFFDLAEHLMGELRSRPSGSHPTVVLLAERHPLKFLAHFIAACAAHCQIVLANPDWAQTEWQQVFEMVEPDIVWGEAVRMNAGSRASGVGSWASNTSSFPTFPTPQILIPTGGTSGKIRFAVHTWDTLMASVEGFRQYFAVDRVDSFCVLPLHHVSGLMQFMRSFTSGGRLVVRSFKAVEAGDRDSVDPETFFLSLVPTQLQRLLIGETGERESESEKVKEPSLATTNIPKQISPSTFNSEVFRNAAQCATQDHPTPHSPHPTPQSSIVWLSRFHTVLLGGAPAWSDLLDRARFHRIRLAPTYGMTETASQIATLKPDDFLKGHTNSGQVLPHAQIIIRSPSGEILSPGQIGTITIQTDSLARSYYPPPSRDRADVTNNCPLTTPSPPPKNSDSGGLGELGPQAAGGRGEVPRTQPLDNPTMLAHHSLEQRDAEFQPDDLGFFDTQGYLHIVGRQSDKIITGGENVFPAEVEAAILSTGLIQDVCVVGVSDRHWGQAIAAVYVPIAPTTTATCIQTALADKLSKFKRPKHWVAVEQLPRNAQGKVNRQEVEQSISVGGRTPASGDFPTPSAF